MTKIVELSLADYLSGDAKRREDFAAALFAGLKDIGFIILKDHLVPVDLLDKAYGLSEQLFARPLDYKLQHKGGQRGYTPFRIEHAKDNPEPDLKEFWQIGRDLPPGEHRGELFPPNVWPREMPGFRDVFYQLFNGLDETGRLVLEAITPFLGQPKNFFDGLVRDSNSVFRVLHYPPVPDNVPPGAVRSAAHEDINLITILVAAKGAGLELLDHDGKWLSVETDPRNLIVDSGDMLMRLTNGLIPATTHRVVNPSGPNVSRYSMPFFLHPKTDTSLAALPSCVGAEGKRFPDITAGDYLMERLREIGLAG